VLSLGRWFEVLRRAEYLLPEHLDDEALPAAPVELGGEDRAGVAAVMCIALTSTMPSCTPDAATASCTSSVMRTNSRRSAVSKVR
jgi:hypothetical protein